MNTVREIVEKWLADNGYEGLYRTDACGCELDDLVPCGECFDDCAPGYKVPCVDGSHDFDIVAHKE